MLSQSHPTYLSQLRTSVSKAKAGSDKAVVSLTIISLGVLCVQTLIGTCLSGIVSGLLAYRANCAGLASMNVNVPHNTVGGTKFNVFGAVIAIAALIIFGYSCVVRYWWVQARRRRLQF